MKMRVFSLFAVVGLSTMAMSASPRYDSAASKRWGTVNFAQPVRVQGYFLMGQVLIVHDDAKMARGEPCTTFYRFDAQQGGQQEPLLSFHCKPARRPLVDETTLTYATAPELGCRRLVAYQLAGDTEAHGIPDR